MTAGMQKFPVQSPGDRRSLRRRRRPSPRRRPPPAIVGETPYLSGGPTDGRQGSRELARRCPSPELIHRRGGSHAARTDIVISNAISPGISQIPIPRHRLRNGEL